MAAVEESLTNVEDLTTTQCLNEPWLIEPKDIRMNFLYLRTNGFSIDLGDIEKCKTQNRIIVYSAANTKERKVICPESISSTAKTVNFFSEGWNYSSVNNSELTAVIIKHARSFVVEFLQREAGFYAVTWMAISKQSPAIQSDSNKFSFLSSSGCSFG